MDKRITPIISIFILILLVQPVSADAFATIGMQGLSMASPESAELINTAICISNPLVCAEGKIIGAVQSEALQALAEQSPETAQAIMTYNQVQGYVETGAEITEDLQVDNSGQVSEGTIQFNEKEGRFGNIIGKDIEQNEIFGKELELNKKEGISTVSFTGENSYINVRGDMFKDIKTGDETTPAFIKLDEGGEVQEADLTASADTSFVFGEKRIDVKEGTRIFYQDGKMNILGNTGDEIDIMDKITDENGDYTFSNSNKIKVLSKDGRLLIEGNKIRGSDFQIGDLRVRGETFADVGEVTLVPEGYLLGKKSIGEWKGMNLITEDKVLLATSKNGLEKYDSWILPDTKRLQAKGEGFEILFNEDNEWAKVEDIDLLGIKAGKGFNLDLQNRDSEGLIPKMGVEGEFRIMEDGKEIFMEDGEILVGERLLWDWMNNPQIEERFEDDLWTYTSPLEIQIKQNGEFLDKKMIVTNFKGFGITNLNSDVAILDETYAENSIYHKTLKNTLSYNYPTIEDFEKISGTKLSFAYNKEDFDGSDPLPLYEPKAIRELLDYWETLPEKSKNSISIINVNDIENQNFAGEAVYNPYDNSLNFGWEGNKDGGAGTLRGDYSTFRHEVGHATHDFVEGKLHSMRSLGGEEYERYYELKNEMDSLLIGKYSKSKEEIAIIEERVSEISPEFNELEKKFGVDNPLAQNSKFSNNWVEVAGEGIYDGNIAEKSILGISWNDGTSSDNPKEGFVRAYGATNINEDIATQIQKIVGDPAFFKQNNLLDEGADPRYKQKIDLIHKYGFITDKEYDAVFNPEKYGLLD